MRLFLGLLFTLLLTVPTLADVVLTTATKSVTTAGTRVRLVSTKILASSILIQANPANGGKIHVGDVTVSSGTGIELDAGEILSISADESTKNITHGAINLYNIYIDATTSGNGVRILYNKLK